AAPLLEESDSRFAESDSSACASLLHASNEAALQPVRDSAQTDADASPDAAASCGNALAEPAGSGGAETFADDARYADTDLAGPVGAVGIAIEGVSFAYDDGRTVLDGVSLEIPPGQKVAVLGRSGSGKSTLASLIRGDLTPTSGSIRIDGTHVSQIGEDVFRYIGVVQQEAYLFNRTLRDNLLIGREDATDEEVWAALDAVELGEMARRLPQGLDTMVDEAGLRFSGGERHRIALARVLLAHVPVILLDEPTVGLDPLTENALLDTLFSSMADKTFVMITHHLQGIERFDRVVFIEDGRIERDGSPADLHATSERSRALRSFDRGIDAEPALRRIPSRCNSSII
ncbi:MAG: ATP-binding cassette domain-containing protein, partial [Eggerthellaceae bacterium]|nr:ATP-binding cassette domain-containing protein [Eggerthellaceae bacterium]